MFIDYAVDALALLLQLYKLFKSSEVVAKMCGWLRSISAPAAM